METLPEETKNAFTGKVVANAVNLNNPYASSMVDKVVGDSLMDDTSLGMIDQIISGHGLEGVTKVIKSDTDVNDDNGQQQQQTRSITSKSGGDGSDEKIRGRDAIKRAMKQAIKAKKPELEQEEEVKVVEEKKIEKVELNEVNMEIAAKALHTLVQHRGGGPFGKGRLSNIEQVQELEENLLNVLSMIKKVDGSGITSGTPITAPKASLMEASPPEAALFDDTSTHKQQLLSQKLVTNITPRPSVPAPVPVGAQTPHPIAQAPPGNSHQPKNIAGGLDDFLRSPQELSPQQLENLRDGLIQCLGMVQQQIASNLMPMSPSQTQTTQPVSVLSPSASSGNTKHLSQEPKTVDEEIRFTLGLLLKHRGGPGFGHGRLEGRELEALETNLKSITSKLREEVTS